MIHARSFTIERTMLRPLKIHIDILSIHKSASLKSRIDITVLKFSTD